MYLKEPCPLSIRDNGVSQCPIESVREDISENRRSDPVNNGKSDPGTIEGATQPNMGGAIQPIMEGATQPGKEGVTQLFDVQPVLACTCRTCCVAPSLFTRSHLLHSRYRSSVVCLVTTSLFARLLLQVFGRVARSSFAQQGSSLLIQLGRSFSVP